MLIKILAFFQVEILLPIRGDQGQFLRAGGIIILSILSLDLRG